MNEVPNPELIGARALSGPCSNESLAWSLRPWARAFILLTPVVAGGIWLSWVTVRAAQSAYRFDSISIDDLQQALSHDPENPELVHRLGLVYTYDQTDINITQSLKRLREAVAL